MSFPTHTHNQSTTEAATPNTWASKTTATTITRELSTVLSPDLQGACLAGKRSRNSLHTLWQRNPPEVRAASASGLLLARPGETNRSRACSTAWDMLLLEVMRMAEHATPTLQDSNPGAEKERPYGQNYTCTAFPELLSLEAVSDLRRSSRPDAKTDRGWKFPTAHNAVGNAASASLPARPLEPCTRASHPQATHE